MSYKEETLKRIDQYREMINEMSEEEFIYKIQSFRDSTWQGIEYHKLTKPANDPECIAVVLKVFAQNRPFTIKK